jgi:hypothetical protein
MLAQKGVADLLAARFSVVGAPASGFRRRPKAEPCTALLAPPRVVNKAQLNAQQVNAMNNARIVRATPVRIQPYARPGLLCALLFIAMSLTACGRPTGPTPAQMASDYEEILLLTAPPKSAVFDNGSPEEQAALDRLEAYFAAMTAESVRDDTAAVYAADAWLYDNLAIVNGAPAIEKYFAKAAADVRALSVDFLQVTRDGPDYFLRWRMSVETEALNDGKPMVSYGITQFRFDEQGRVLVHRDFWDAATGLYEYIPGLGGLIRSVRSRLAEAAEE